jgi:hypothetical protein
MKICAVEAKLIHVDRQMERWTDMTQQTGTLHNYTNVYKKIEL